MTRLSYHIPVYAPRDPLEDRLREIERSVDMVQSLTADAAVYRHADDAMKLLRRLRSERRS